MLEQLYTIIEIADNVARVRLNPESAIYKAHFPGNPITPGVCQVGMVEELAAKICGCGLFLREVKMLKFMEIMKPSEVEVEVRFDRIGRDGDTVEVKGAVMSGGRIFTKFSLIFGVIA